MSEAPVLERQYTLATLRPNPLWIPNELDILLLEMLHFNSGLEEQGIIFMGKIDCRDDNMERAIDEIDQLAEAIAPHHKKILLKLSRETTVEPKSYFDIRGQAHPREDQAPFRQYFDGSSVADRSDMGHSCGVCIDLEQEQIYVQDPQGIPIKEDIIDALAGNFPTFEIHDLQMKQQHDVSSCSLITHSNLQRFAAGLPFIESIDIDALRLGYIRDIERAERSLEQATGGEFTPPTQKTGYYESPVFTLRYMPV